MLQFPGLQQNGITPPTQAPAMGSDPVQNQLVQKYGPPPAVDTSTTSSTPQAPIDHVAALEKAKTNATQTKAASDFASSPLGFIKNYEMAGLSDGLKAGAQAVMSVPKSEYGLAKNTVEAVIHPVDTLQGLGNMVLGGIRTGVKSATGLDINPSQSGQQASDTFSHVATALKDKYGSLENLQKYATNDPASFGADVLSLVGGGAALAGKGASVDKAISDTASLVTKPISKITEGAGNATAGILGVETGAGAPSIKAAVGGSPEFTAAMRGQTTAEDIVNQAEQAFSTLKQNRASEYQGKLAEIAKNSAPIDITPIAEQMKSGLEKFGVSIAEGEGGVPELDFSRSPVRFDAAEQTRMKKIFDEMKTFGVNPEDRTAVGVDSLKRAIGSLYSPNSDVRAFVQGMKDATRKVLNDNVPGYEDMTKGYAKTSDLLDDIKSATAIGGKAKSDTIFTKLTTALKTDKDFRMQMLGELENGSGQKLIDAIAGSNMSKWIPSGLTGRALDASAAFGAVTHVFNPAMLPLILSTSPRIVGEFLNGIGVAKKYIQPIINSVKAVNEFKTPEMISEYVKNPQLGLAMKDVVKAIDAPTKAELVDAVDYLRNGTRAKNIEDTVSRLAQKFGYSEDIGSTALANKFQDLIEKTKTMDKLPG